MALLQKTRIISQERIDLKDYRNLEDFVCADFKAIYKYTQASSNFVYSGFEATGTGTNQLSIAVANSALVVGGSDGTLYVGAPSLAAITNNTLTPSATNYVEIEVVQDSGGADSRAIWDQTANAGQGGEFSQIIDTYIFQDARLVINTASFSGGTNKVQICEVDVDGSGIITQIRDARNLFFRLGRANNANYTYAWSSRVEPVNTQFTGADKNIKREKDWKDAVMSRIAEIDGVQNWFATSGTSTAGTMRNAGLSVVSSIGNGAFWRWDGSKLELSDLNATPAVTDKVSAIRMLDSTANLQLTRQEEGREIQKVTFSLVPTGGSIKFEQDGDISNSIAFNASASDVLTACNATFTNQLLSVTGDYANGFKFVFLNAGPQVAMTVDSNSLKRGGANVIATPSVVRTGFTGSQSFSMSNGDVLWVEIPKPVVSQDYAGIGITSVNYRISARGSVPLNDSTYWLAFREGNNIYIRNLGELAPGETMEISDNVSENIIQAIGLASETSMPSYESTNFVTQGGSIVHAISELDGRAKEHEDRLDSMMLNVLASNISRATVNAAEIALLNGNTQGSLLGTSLMDLSGAQIDFQTGNVYKEDGVTALGNSFTPFTIPVGQFFWYGVSIVPGLDTADNKSTGLIQVDPAQSADAVKASAKKPNITGDVKLGAVQVYNNAGTIEIVDVVNLPIGSGSGSGSGAFKVRTYDAVSTSLPTGVSVVSDGVTLANGDLVLFSNLSSGNNRIYKLSGVGSSIVWTPQRAFSSQFDPTDGDSVRIQTGDAFRDQLAVFNGTNFLVNDTMRFFDGVSANFWELGSIKSTSIADNTTDNVFSVNVAGSENIIVEYSIVRGLAKETGQLFITSDGTNAAVTKASAYLSDVGVEFSASISVGVLQLDYTSDNSGSTGTLKYFIKRWSDSPGGPSGVPSYSGGGSGGSAGGANTEVQFNNSGSLDGDSRFKWDASAGAIDLNGAKFGVLSSGITLNDNQVAPALAFQYAKSFSFVIIEYSIVRDTDYRVGRLLVPNNGSSVSLSDDFVETGSTGITFSVSVSGANINVNYTSTSTGFTGTLKYTIRKWS